VIALFLANIKILVRNREALFWALAFPLIFVLAFGLFDLDGGSQSSFAIIDQSDSALSKALTENLAKVDSFHIQEELTDEAAALEALEAGDIDFVLVFPEEMKSLIPGAANTQSVAITLYKDESNIQQNQIISGVLRQFLDEVNFRVANVNRLLTLQEENLYSKQVSYFDFILPGLVGMGVMIFSITFVATNIARYREQKILKRMQATPLRVSRFFVAQILAFLAVSVVQGIIILAAGVLIFGAHVYGSYLDLIILVVIANIIFLNIGFIVAALTKSVNAASGFANVVAMPMMFFSGAFFPNELLPEQIRSVVQLLPLTPLLDAMRVVALDAEPIWMSVPQLAMLAGWIVVTSVLAIRLFKFS
jgi:ABC-2 type transport system permease protein